MKKNSIDHIYELYMTDVHRYLLALCHHKQIAEDIMQETFFKAYLNFEACPIEGVKPWLFRIARNAYIDFQRKNSRNITEGDEFFKIILDDKTIEEELISREQLKELEKFIEELPHIQKQAILHCYYNELSTKEAAMILGVRLSCLKVNLFRGRQMVRKKIEGRE